MKPYKTVIVDDEAHALSTLSSYIEKTPTLSLNGIYENPLDALETLSGANPPDIAFLDIDMPELSGLELANLASSKIKIVFISAYPQFTLQAFNVFAAGYLLKPYSFETFYKLVQKICPPPDPLPNSSTKPVFFKANVKGKYIRLMSDAIIYIEAMLNYVKIYTQKDDRPVVIYLSMKEAESKLGNTFLVRVSRSFIVNTADIESVNANTITMVNGKQIRIGQLYKSDFYKYLNSNSMS
ncbi:MAG TPA: LytTR family DNA-binding domain-containing protein [Pedobacter sp.]|nr:LytTR family DNA-binding domain-containing protein [Pedobacter sp.]